MRSRRERQRAFVLLAVLIVSALASLVVVSLLYEVRAESTAVAARRSSEQAYRAAQAGIDRVFELVSGNEHRRERWFDVPDDFEKKLVADDGINRWYFTVYSRNPEELDDRRFGVEDQSACLVQNAADASTIARVSGLSPKEVEKHLRHREPIAESPLGTFLSKWRTDYTLDSKGRWQVDLNRDIDPIARLPISEKTIEFIAAARKLATGPRPAFTHVSQLLSATLTISEEDASSSKTTERTIDSNVDAATLSILLDQCRTSPRHEYSTKTVNVNTASERLLQTVPGIDQQLAESIVRRRESVDADSRLTTAWLLTEGIVDASRFRSIAPMVCARGYQFRFRVIGYGRPSGRFRVFDVVIDTRPGRPRVLWTKERTRDGLPFALDDDERDEFDGEYREF